MRTKEEILGAWKRVPSNMGDIDIVVKEHAFSAMDEYAKEIAIGFLLWYLESDYSQSYRERQFTGMFSVSDDPTEDITSYQLFNTYTQTLQP